MFEFFHNFVIDLVTQKSIHYRDANTDVSDHLTELRIGKCSQHFPIFLIIQMKVDFNLGFYCFS